jgi:hypothetical protein
MEQQQDCLASAHDLANSPLQVREHCAPYYAKSYISKTQEASKTTIETSRYAICAHLQELCMRRTTEQSQQACVIKRHNIYVTSLAAMT